MPSSVGSAPNTPRRGRRKSKKTRSKKGDREVLVHGCLPPQVDGQIRCFVVVCLKKVSWTISKYPADVFLRCLWWGEMLESAAIFSPSESKVVARYPVRSGPRQMAAYLTDAGTLHVDVLRGGDMSIIGKVQIYGLSALAAGKSLSGPYPIFSSKSEIIGHINVDVSMQALHTFEDSSSSIVPTTDMDNTEHSENIVEEGRIDTKLGTPSAYSSVLSQQQMPKTPESATPVQQEDKRSSSQGIDEDLISNLLAKGQRLRSAMISSTIDSTPGGGNLLYDDIKPTEAELIDSRAMLGPQSKAFTERRRHPELQTVDLILGSPQKRAVYMSDTDSVSSLGDEFELSDMEDPAHDQEILDLLFYKHSTKSGPAKQVDAETTTSGAVTQPKSSSEQAAVDTPAQRGSRERRPSVEDVGNLRPPSRSASASPRICLSLPPSPSGNQSDSGTSRVSFDMTASDDEDTRSAAEGLSVEQLTLLARVSVARVQIDKMNLKERPNTPVEKRTYKGRPPPAKTSKYGVYFVEYQFPVVAASRDQGERNTTATETVRAVSKKVEKSGAVTWNHYTVFPVFFDGQTVEKWWNSMLVLKIHHRSQTSRTATLIGSCSIQMKQLLQSLTFGLDLEIPVTKFNKQSSGRSKRRRRRADIIGTMKVNLQLDSDSPSFGTALRELQIAKARKQHPLLKPKPETPIVAPAKPDYVKSDEPVRVGIQAPLTKLTERQHEDLMLHVLLHVSEGRQLRTSHLSQPIISGGTISSYAVCRIFWSSDRLRSEVCWSSHTPDYMINETMPLHVTKEVLTTMSNNYMVLEVWEKKTTSQKDQLLGYAKLPLNTFYMSYKEPTIAQVLMKSQYPVIAVDSFMPIVNPLTGKNMGEVKVLLAMGTQEQIMSLQTLKVIATATQLEQRQHMEHQQALGAQSQRLTAERDVDVVTTNGSEHRFDIKVMAVRDLTLDESMYMGEADCFVQYHFPSQHADSNGLALKAFRSATTLCTDSVVFDDRRSHVITLPGETTLQSALISAFGHLHGAAVPFELWCRFYHPNTRDQLMAKSLLPLAKLLGLVTMANDSDPVNSQSYSLPLVPASNRSKAGTVGVLDVTIQHARKVSRQHAARGAPSLGIHTLGHVTLSASIDSITGLKSAALALSHRHQCLDYYSTVGVNLYVKVMLSFQPKSEVRVSKTEPRTFYLEEFGFKTLFELPLMLDSNTSLAHCLHSGYLVVEVWHQSLKDSILDDCPGIAPSTDILLGITSVPLNTLLSHKTGVKGWYPVNCPPELYTTTQSHDPIMGAVKVQMRLTGSQDINTIIDNASKMGYQLPSPGLDTTDVVVDEMTEVKIEVDWFTIPDRLVLKSEHDVLPIHSGCYIKTSFYSNDPTYSDALRLSDKGDNFECKCTVNLKYMQSANTSFLWYLFDQHLELELWLSNKLDVSSDKITPSSSDKYLGTAYVPLGELSKRRQCTVSDVYPIYKANTERMGRSLIQIHLSRRPHQDPEVHQMKVCRQQRSDEAPVTQLEDMDSSSQSEGDSLDEDTIESMISVEEANRLAIGQSPGATLHVSYSLAGREHITSGVPSSSKPSWMYEKCVRLHLPSIQKAKHLVLKLWCKTEEKGSQVLGFTTIDLRPLLAGMSHLSGWYNIVDFTGLCQGQIKCGIEPLTRVDKRNMSGSSSPQTTVKKPLPSVADTNDRFFTAAGYTEFPSHISRFSEQHVSLSFHQPSTSSELLRKQLSELDIMTTNLRQKLYKSQDLVKPATTSIDAPGTAAHSKLLSTVNQVHSNVLQLVEHGVVTPDQILAPHHTSRTDGGSTSTDDPAQDRQRNNSSTSTSSVSVHGNSRQLRATSSPSPFTPRSQATYSMPSDDEQFSPPIFTRHRDAKAIHSTEELGQSSDWASDGVKRLSSGEDDSPERPPPDTEHNVNRAAVSASDPYKQLDDLEELASDTEKQVQTALPGKSQLTLAVSGGWRTLPPVDIATTNTAPFTMLVSNIDSSSVAKGDAAAAASQVKVNLTTTPLEEKGKEEEDVMSDSGSIISQGGDATSHGTEDVISPEVDARSSMNGDGVLSEDVMSDCGEMERLAESDRLDAERQWTDDEMDYEEEEAVSRTLNEDLSPLDDMSDQAFGTFHDSSLGLDSSLHKTYRPAAVDEPSQTRLSPVRQITPRLVEATSSSPRESLDDLEPGVSRGGGQSDNQQYTENIDSDTSEDINALASGATADDRDRNNTDSTSAPTMTQTPVDTCSVASHPTHTNHSLPATPKDEPPTEKVPKTTSLSSLPSFFPSREELAAKLNAAKEESKTKDRFARRKPISWLAREQCQTADRAKRVADIFATRFNQDTS